MTASLLVTPERGSPPDAWWWRFVLSFHVELAYEMYSGDPGGDPGDGRFDLVALEGRDIGGHGWAKTWKMPREPGDGSSPRIDAALLELVHRELVALALRVTSKRTLIEVLDGFSALPWAGRWTPASGPHPGPGALIIERPGSAGRCLLVAAICAHLEGDARCRDALLARALERGLSRRNPIDAGCLARLGLRGGEGA
ncbi:MAG: hypothetical protein K8T90_03815 [Planctomycetes bacterium]|nr:hypothetical protein [Planctomycetota bacterium]